MLVLAPIVPALPDAALGNSSGTAFRNYTPSQDPIQARVQQNYALNHTHQTHEFAREQAARWCRFDWGAMSLWEALELMCQVVDDSDPDTELPQVQHVLQTAEACRRQFPQEEWLHVVGLIHDLGKVLAHPRFGPQPQWAVVGDTFPTACAHDPCVVFSELFAANPDSARPEYSSACGIYPPGCGLDAVTMSWGHDEYLYQVLRHSGTLLPPEALFVVRYHSFYALHQHGAYAQLLDDSDRAMLPWLKAFQKCDLYSKSNAPCSLQELRPYYEALVSKFFPRPVLQW